MNVGDKLHQLMENNRIIEVRIHRFSGRPEPTWATKIGNFECKIPQNEAGIEAQYMPFLVGQKIRVVIIGVDHIQKMAVLSRQQASEILFSRAKPRLEAEPGRPVTGIVRFFSSDSVFVEIAGRIAAMPRHLASHSRNQKPDTLFSPGQKIQVKISNFEPFECERTSLLPDPWQNLFLDRKDLIDGNVVAFSNGRPLIEISEGIVGIAPPPLSFSVRRGDQVLCQVVRVVTDKKQIHLRIKKKLGGDF